MGNPLYYILFSLLSGFFLKHSLLLIAIPLSFILFFAFRRRLAVSLCAALALLSGYFLSFEHPLLLPHDGEYLLEAKVKRSLRYDYIAEGGGLNLLLKSDYSFFEGDVIYGKFSVKRIEGKNDYEKYLLESGIFLSAKIEETDSVKSAAGVDRLRTILINRVNAIYGDEKVSGFINSLLWGYRKDLNPKLKQGFLHSGVIHLIAISGQHTTVIFGLIMALLFPLPLPRKVKMILSGGVILFYGWLTYLNPPVMRAVIFIFIVITGQLFSRDADNENMLLISMIMMLVFNSSNFNDEGFMLSFIAVYGLFITPKVAASRRTVLRILASSAVILLLTLPYMMLRFKYVSIGSPFFTLILLPLFNFMLPISLLSLIPFFSVLSYPVKAAFFLTERAVGFSENLPLFFNVSIDGIAFVLLFSAVILTLNRKTKEGAAASLLLFIYSLLKISCL